MFDWRAFFDDSIDAAAREGRRTAMARLVTSVVAGAFIALNVSLLAGAGWFAAVLASEASIWVITGLIERAKAPSLGRRAAYIAADFAGTTIWSASALLYWSTGRPALEIVAVASLGAQLLHAQSLAFRSQLALASGSVVPAAAIFILPVFFGGFTGLERLTVAVGMVTILLYSLNAARENQATTDALRQAREEARAQSERAVAASNAKSDFLAMMSHELRTPMNGVLGMAHALKSTRLDGRQADYVGMLIRSGDGLMTLLNDILDISKIEAGKLELEHAPFDLCELAERAVDLWREVAAEKGVGLALRIEPEAPRWVAGDQTRVRQIMLNLLSNALKFTAEGEVLMVLSSDRRGRARIVVADTGVGISAEQQGRLFSTFVQADASTTRQFGGTGLGLAICKQLAQRMGGDIVLESALGSGSTFTVALPLAASEPPAAEPARQSVDDLNGCKVLVVEDNLINQAVARAILEAVGASVETATDGLEALEVLRNEAFDVVLMDVHMPRMGGPEALTRIRAGEAGRVDIPVIALTADAFAAEEGRLAALGFDAVQPKPIRPAELLAAIAMERGAPGRLPAGARRAEPQPA